MFRKLSSVSYFRNFIFGVEDGVVSTVGLLSGIAVANIPRTTILITGVVLIFVEAVSMAAGSFLSESSVEEYNNHREKISKSTFISGAIMFFSYFIAGSVVLSPYIIFSVSGALKISILVSILLLFVLGVTGAKISNINIFKSGLRMVVVGGIAIIVGLLAGSWISSIQ